MESGRIPFIRDKNLFKAIAFAVDLMANEEPSHAISIAANYYCFSTKDVAHYVGMYANSFRGRRQPEPQLKQTGGFKITLDVSGFNAIMSRFRSVQFKQAMRRMAADAMLAARDAAIKGE